MSCENMGWLTKVIVLVALQYIAPSCGVPHPFPLASLNNDNYPESTGVLDEDNTDSRSFPETVDTEKLDLMGNYLTELLLLPSNGKGLPLLYIEEEPSDDLFNDLKDDEQQQYNSEIAAAPFKRSRYYRKYPWKRQNSRQTACSNGKLATEDNFQTKWSSNWIAPKAQAHPRRQNRHSSFLYATKYNSPKSHPRVIKHTNKKEYYDAENRYLCQPSKDDVLRLLVALHEARQGTKGRTINFCNRKRPATAIFTNIRFLG